MPSNRPMFTPQGLVSHLKEEGVRFKLMDEESAVRYLTQSTNFFKINTYKKNYAFHVLSTDPTRRQYEDLEFAYLRELDNIDRSLRRVLSVLCLDVEHFIKVRLLRLVQADDKDDGYRLVRAFCQSLGQGSHSLKNEIERNAQNPYCAAVTEKYDTDDLPVWAFVEVIPFGRLLRLYQFAAKERALCEDERLAQILEFVRDMRNAVAHNNCLLCDLSPKRSQDPFYACPPDVLTHALFSLGIKQAHARTRLSNPRVAQLTALLYVHPLLVTDAEMREDAYRELREVVDGRMLKHREYFIKNALLQDCYRLLKLQMDAWCV